MIKTVIFFNSFHNGDVHLSRTFAEEVGKFLLNNLGVASYYAHNNELSLLKDMDYVKSVPMNFEIEKNIPSKKQNETVYLNTWYGVERFAWIKRYGITYNCLYHLFEAHLNRYFKLSLKNISSDLEYFFPAIKFERFFIDEIANWVDKYRDRKKVFISNCEGYSGQPKMHEQFNMAAEILAARYPSFLFILTNEAPATGNNIIYSKEIIKKAGNDLNENAFLSTKCDIIVGNCSGPHTFAYNKTNFFESTKSIIVFSHTGIEGTWFRKEDFPLNYKCRMECYNGAGVDDVVEIIDANIQRIL